MGHDDLKAAQATCQPETTEPFYTLQEAAHHLNVRVLDLEHAIQNHRLPFTHQFGRKLIAASALEAYRAQQHLGEPSETSPPQH